MLQDYDDLRQIEVQLDKVLELTGECGFVKGFDPYVGNDYKKWGTFVAEAAKRRLVPLLRLGYGQTPSLADAERFATYVEKVNEHADSLFKGAKIKVVEVWNEPNLAEEWGGNPNPEAYARFLYASANRIKQKNPAVKVMNGGLAMTEGDALNINTEEFIERMFASVPRLVDVLDLWSSHPYPQNFSHCPPSAFGASNPKYCFNAFESELVVLEKIYAASGHPLPRIFISETSWRSSTVYSSIQGSYWEGARQEMYSPEEFAKVWRFYWLLDNRIVGVTPFQFVTKNPKWRDFNMLDPENLQGLGYFFEIKKLREEVQMYGQLR